MPWRTPPALCAKHNRAEQVPAGGLSLVLQRCQPHGPFGDAVLVSRPVGWKEPPRAVLSGTLGAQGSLMSMNSFSGGGPPRYQLQVPSLRRMQA